MVGIAEAFNIVFAALGEVLELLGERMFPSDGACFVDDGDELVEVVRVGGRVEELRGRGLARKKRHSRGTDLLDAVGEVVFHCYGLTRYCFSLGIQLSGVDRRGTSNVWSS